MASFVTQTLFLLFFTLFSTFSITINGEFSSQSIITSTKRMEKMTLLHFYFHDIVDGKNPTAIKIIRPANKSTVSFGTTFMVADPLTEKPEPNSKLVGRAQGIYALASQHEIGLLMVMNFAFSDGIYNGSALSILGRNAVLNKVREMPIVGGSGIFRFARGYALAKTVWFNQIGDVVVEYNVSVVHY
ncbi:dirigent protein 22-like [Durio zibethinus]|uniref:Dirigent protein n=1 Tax=Durio zibethinus TaxID=66656 RepID=A0A6P5Z5D5_DURZI|nr:dirigent protein 22-like [Durio zibethinus]